MEAQYSDLHICESENSCYDVVVIGGGCAGIAAAWGAARLGKRVALCERNPYLGGQSTASFVASYCGFYTRGQNPTQAVGGVGGMVLERLVASGLLLDPSPSISTGNVSLPFEPERVKIIYEDLLNEAGVELWLHTSFVNARCITATTQAESSPQDVPHYLITLSDDAGLHHLKATSCVDATGNANVINMLGLPYAWGDEQGAVQQASLTLLLGGLPVDKHYTMQDIQTAIKVAKAAGIQGLHKEQGMFLRSIKQDGTTSTYTYCTLPSASIAALDGKSLAQTEATLRKQAQVYVTALKTYLSGAQNCELIGTNALGIREARRIIGETTLCGTDILNLTQRPDSIARAAWSPEVHTAQAHVSYTHMPDNSYASIPLGCLKPKNSERLWCAGRMIATDCSGLASIRVMGTSFATGHAAGIAAAYNTDKAFTEPDFCKSVQTALVQQGALI